MKGKFITIEGGEGVGKTTQIMLMAEKLKALGKEVVITREPGGTPGGEEIRQLLVTGESGRWDAVTEMMLFFASRRDHTEKLIKPALEKGIWVISDRYADSSFAYQSYGKGLPLELLFEQYRIALGNFEPDLTIFFDLASKESLQKALFRDGEEKRFEREGMDFHERVTEGFRDLAKKFSHRYETISEWGSIEEINEKIMGFLQKRFNIS